MVAHRPLLFEWHGRWSVQHVIEVLFADGALTWTLDFSGGRGPASVSRGAAPSASSRTSVTASALLRVVAGALTWEQLVRTGDYRYDVRAYHVGRWGLVAAPASRIPDPLRALLGTTDAEERAVAAVLSAGIDVPGDG